MAPELTSQDILHYIPSLKDICEVETLQLCNLDSTNISMEHWMMMANAIEEKYEKYDGFVICHGTDTMAYTASALSYLVQHSPKPIVLTGSQKPVDMEITDARANLLDSFIYASSDSPRQSPESASAVRLFGPFCGKIPQLQLLPDGYTESYGHPESLQDLDN